MKTTTLITLCTLALALPLSAGDKPGKGGREHKGEGREGRERPERGERPGSEAFRAFMKEQHEARREYHMAQRKEFEALHESLREGDAAAGCKALAEHATVQKEKHAAFAKAQHHKLTEFVKADAAKNEVPEEKLNQRLEQMAKRHAEMTARFSEMQDKRIAALTALSKQEDLTWEQVREAMKELHPRGRGGRGGEREKGKRGGDRERKHKREKPADQE